jgi:hypothetical protein
MKMCSAGFPTADKRALLEIGAKLLLSEINVTFERNLHYLSM